MGLPSPGRIEWLDIIKEGEQMGHHAGFIAAIAYCIQKKKRFCGPKEKERKGGQIFSYKHYIVLCFIYLFIFNKKNKKIFMS